jgi:hypothetical protein
MTRASMMKRGERQSYGSHVRQLIMDGRVKPGHDNREAGATTLLAHTPAMS